MKNLFVIFLILLFAGIVGQTQAAGVWPDTVWGWAFNSSITPAPGIPYPSDAWASIEYRTRDDGGNCMLFLTKKIGQNEYAMAFKNFAITLPETVEVDYFLLDIKKDSAYQAGPGSFAICTIVDGNLNWITEGRSLNTEARNYWTGLRVNIAFYKKPFKIQLIERLVFFCEGFNTTTQGCQLDNLRLVTVTGEVFWLDGMGDSVALGLEPPVNAPSQFRLGQNYPNPFNPKTVISYQLPVVSEVELNVYNTLGQRVATLVSAKQPAGKYKVEWDATGFASGVYFYRLIAGDKDVTKKMILMK